MKFRLIGLVLVVLLLILFPSLVLLVRADPCAILQVSLPDGAYVGYNNDPWLSECWLLNLTGASQTFLVRINNTSAAIRSYDTRLVIALNDAGYNGLESLVVNGTIVPKSAFTYGTPRPYNLWTWPSGDVYPIWSDDNSINFGMVQRKGSVDLIVSVTFSDATGVKIHFDAYGCRSYPPSNAGQITHNPLSWDSTVLLQQGIPPPQPPFASFFYIPSHPETYETVTFDASDSYDPDGYIASYAWDFGDGTPIVVETDPVTYHAYTSYGDYTVRLIVTDNDDLTDETTMPIHISQRPVASFTFSPPDPMVHETVTFDASSSSPDGGVIISYEWDFGDGSPIVVESDPITGHSYSTYGNYTVTLKITDSEGKWDTASKIVEVTAAPIADFFWLPYYPQRYEAVKFDASISAPDGGVIVSYEWDFGDGNITIVSDPTIIHHYTAVGDYTVTLNVTNSMGRWDTVSKTIAVVERRYFLEVETEPADLVTIPGEGWYNESTDVVLTAPEYVDVSTGIRYKFIYWDVDGTSYGAGVKSITVHMNANHTATAHYVLQYLLTVQTDPSGLSPQPTRNPTGEAGPANSWWYDASTSVTLTAQSVTGYTFNYWDVDGASQGSGVNPITVNMNAPHTATAYYTSIPPPSVSINPLSASIYVGQSVVFTSSVSGGTTPYSYQWYLNGAPVSGATSSSWTFTSTTSGIYYVYLKVTDANNNVVQSDTSRITVSSVSVGGYSISLAKQTPTTHIAAYTTLIALFAAALSLTKRKRK